MHAESSVASARHQSLAGAAKGGDHQPDADARGGEMRSSEGFGEKKSRQAGRLGSVSVTPELLSVQFGGKCKCDKTLLKYEIVKSNHSHSAARH